MKVIVVDYNHRWPHYYEVEKLLLIKSLGVVMNSIHHIGSTSIAGMSAKPIIDILINVVSLDSIDAHEDTMLSLGYVSHGELGIVGRRYFSKGGRDRSHQIHAFVHGDTNIFRHIAFRDYITAHPTIANAYADLKIGLAKKFSRSIDDYCDGKNTFIKRHELQAIEWVKSLGLVRVVTK